MSLQKSFISKIHWLLLPIKKILNFTNKTFLFEEPHWFWRYFWNLQGWFGKWIFNFNLIGRPLIFGLQYYEAKTLEAWRLAESGPIGLKIDMWPPIWSLQLWLSEHWWGPKNKKKCPRYYTEQFKRFKKILEDHKRIWLAQKPRKKPRKIGFMI